MSVVNEGTKTFTSGEALAENRRVKLSSGTVVYADAYDRSIGVTVNACASGDNVAVKLHNHTGTRKFIAASSVTSGVRVYGAADGKVNDTFAGSGESLGIALQAADGDGAEIEVLVEPGGSTLLYEIIAQSDAGGTSTASEFTFSNGSVAIPADQIEVGDILRIRAKGSHPSTNGSDTFKGRLYINTEKICETPNPDAVNDDVFIIDAEVVVRAVGASGSLVASGYTMNDALAAGLATPFALAAATEDLTTTITIAIKGLWDASSASNASRLDIFTVERIRR